MPHWYLKAAIQGALSRFPEPQRYNRLFQRHVTRVRSTLATITS